MEAPEIDGMPRRSDTREFSRISGRINLLLDSPLLLGLSERVFVLVDLACVTAAIP